MSLVQIVALDFSIAGKYKEYPAGKLFFNKLFKKLDFLIFILKFEPYNISKMYKPLCLGFPLQSV